MGKIFTWDEVENGKIPQQSDFLSVATHMRESLNASAGIVGGVLCGSVLYGATTQRSDIDCVIVYDPMQRREVIQTLQYLRSSAACVYVPIEFIPVDMSIAPTPLHSIGPSFAAHLHYAVVNGGLIKKNPLPLFMIGSDHTSDEEDVRGYLRNKFRRFEKDTVCLSMMTESDLCRFLQKILEVAMHIARKILWVNHVPMSNDSKQEVIKRYPDISTAREYELFFDLVRADDSYAAELARQLKYINPIGYCFAINEIKNRVRSALEFIKLSALRVA